MVLEEYNQKRDFSRTTEPPGSASAVPRPSSPPRFVVQEHHARALHYDFRLEMDGILKSWAVPKGPPASTKERRLAIQTEDHPLSYIDFSGDIAPGNYGAGHVTIWDHGTYELLSDQEPSTGIKRGKLEIALHGDRLNGKYDLIRTNDERDEWLMIKSVKPIDAPVSDSKTPAKQVVEPLPDPKSINCMLAETADAPFDDGQWSFEIKWDGYRALLFADRAGTRLISRNKIDFTTTFPELANLSSWIADTPCIIDGEIVALSSDGKASFQTLQNRAGFRKGRKSEHSGSKTAIKFLAFDLLRQGSEDLTSLPLSERRDRLSRLIKAGGPVRISDSIIGKGVALFDQVQKLGVEGIVAKRLNSKYVQNRSGDWLKIKVLNTADVIIAGYTESKAAGRPFASLLIGAFDGNALVSLGHVGAGFNEQTMADLKKRLEAVSAAKSPFAKLPDTNGAAHWVRPELVCEVAFTAFTDDRQLRHPVYRGLRIDKPAAECQLRTITPSTHAAAATSSVSDALKQSDDRDGAQLEFGKNSVALTHLNKVYWPETQTTKRDLLRYYEAVAGALLPHLKDRPLIIQRYPDGVGKPGFFQHDMPATVPAFLDRYAVEEQGRTVHYALCSNTEGLLYLANLGAIPLHTWNIRTQKPECPDRIVFDLDPTAEFADAVPVAHALRQELEDLGLPVYLKTSGGNGLHLTVPVKPVYSDDLLTGFAKAVAERVVKALPDQATMARRISARKGSQVYVDVVQNGIGKTVVAPYSVRAQPAPTVSTPIAWSELIDGFDPTQMTINSVPERLEIYGDLYNDVVTRPADITKALEKLGIATAAGSASGEKKP